MSEPTDYMYWQGVVEIVTMYQILVAAGNGKLYCNMSLRLNTLVFLFSR